MLTRLAATVIIAASATTILVGGWGMSYAQTPSNSSGSQVQFQVVATTSTTTVSTTTTAVPETATTTGVSVTTTFRPSAAGGLPLTGGPIFPATMTALALTVLGLFLLAVIRRRRA
jgi:hypothetical protein